MMSGSWFEAVTISVNISQFSEITMHEKIRKYWKQSFGVFVLIGVLTVTLTMLPATGGLLSSGETSDPLDRSQLIKFSHQFHINEVGVSCVDCHDGASSSTLSSDNLISKKPNCQSCHEEQLESNCSFCHTSDDPSNYLPLLAAKRDIRFSHSFHINEQKAGCESCHKGLESVDYAGAKNLPTMESCNTCHATSTASIQCETCHTDLAALRPVAHNRTDFIKEHKRIARLDDRSCSACHSLDSCQDCHNQVGINASTASGRDFVAPLAPRLFGIDRGEGMALRKVHDLNFRFTHGISARSNASNCSTCHISKDFCSTCHMAGGHVNQLRFKPESHQQAGFKTIGVGSGGGLHAQLARRDMENCASCHDTQGADPTCITCHTDGDGVKGTDPRTHQRGFMLTNNGEWHSDPGANCFMCHTDANARPKGLRGVGFCGYCHK